MKRRTKWISIALVLALALVLLPATVRGEGAPPGLTGGSLTFSNASFAGENLYDEAGRSIASAGDVNGDGYDDLLIGAPEYNSRQGRAYLYLGGIEGWRINDNLGNADAIYTGEATQDQAGFSVSGAGDVNNDGYDDMLISSPGISRVYLVLGSASPAGASLGTADAMYDGENSGSYGCASVAGAGDVNGDGHDDILIGDYAYNSNQGRSYIILGSASPSDTALGSADAIYTGEAAGDSAGFSVAGVGDVDGDYFADFLIGAQGFNSNQGRAYLILGSGSLFSTNLASADAIYTGESTSDYAGNSVAGAGDVNGDGLADLIIGAYGNDDGGSAAGRAYLVLGNANLGNIALSDADAIYTGESANNYAGNSVAGAGDVNGDGYSDLLIGANGYNSDAGGAYLILGSASPISSSLSVAEARYTGENDYDYAGLPVAAAGDVNGDGLSDLLIGATQYQGGSTRIGKVYLIFSDYAPPTETRTQLFKTNLAGLPSSSPEESVGESDVTIAYNTPASNGHFYITRHTRNTCGDFATNGLLWTVNSQLGETANVNLTFKYTNSQITGMTEGSLKLYYRDRPCQDWTEDTGATLDTNTNRITSGSITDPHGEYTIAPQEPTPTRLGLMEFETTTSGAPVWQIALLVGLVILVASEQIITVARER